MSSIRTFEGRRYEIIFGSDVQRDGIYLELSDRTDEIVEVLAEVFFYDEHGKAIFNVYKNGIPLQLIHWLVELAAKEGWPINWLEPPQ
ncbi:hypothetical protein [Pseudomonas paralcaligenes]|uniref:hypothetical protein n=1 Tax=Pseudomonas paralcaligenes TaxID=2772558 RepID=UPI001C8144BB|nr:hypothetical protein [Pseudomonas paralcaligenes]